MDNEDDLILVVVDEENREDDEMINFDVKVKAEPLEVDEQQQQEILDLIQSGCKLQIIDLLFV